MNPGYAAHQSGKPSFICVRQPERARAAVNPVPSQLQLLTTVTGEGGANLKGNL